LRNNAIPKGFLSLEWLFYSKDVQRAKMLAIQKESNVELKDEPKKCIQIGSECIEEEN